MLQRTLTVEMIQNLYSQPRSVAESSIDQKDDEQCLAEGEYCVGGAFMLIARDMGLLREVKPFPEAAALEKAFAGVFGGKPEDWDETVHDIATANDMKEFNAAWAVLDRVLRTHEPI